MAAARRQGALPRTAALIALATLAVHQLRYLLAYGSAAHQELASQGHAYLSQSLPVLIGFGAAALGAGLARAALRASPAGPAAHAPRRRALLYSTAIVAAFALEESLEGLLFGGHASGIAAVVGAGGWIALPLASLFGVLCAVLDGGLSRLEALLAGAVPPAPPLRAPRRHGNSTSRDLVPLASLPLAFGLARRPPPRIS